MVFRGSLSSVWYSGRSVCMAQGLRSGRRETIGPKWPPWVRVRLAGMRTSVRDFPHEIGQSPCQRSKPGLRICVPRAPATAGSEALAPARGMDTARGREPRGTKGRRKRPHREERDLMCRPGLDPRHGRRAGALVNTSCGPSPQEPDQCVWMPLGAACRAGKCFRNSRARGGTSLKQAYFSKHAVRRRSACPARGIVPPVGFSNVDLGLGARTLEWAET